MASFHRVGHEQVNGFQVDDTYPFTHSFEGEDVSEHFKRYYNNQQYRFEVLPADFDEIREFLDRHGYGLVVVDVIEEFIVVVWKYTALPNNIAGRSRSTDRTTAIVSTEAGIVFYDRQDHRAWINPDDSIDMDELR